MSQLYVYDLDFYKDISSPCSVLCVLKHDLKNFTSLAVIRYRYRRSMMTLVFNREKRG